MANSSHDVQAITVPEAITGAQKRALWLLLGAAVVAMLNETTMGVAIPHLIGDLGITALAAQWLTTAFMLTMAVIIPITGFLLRRFTTRQVFITAMGLFSLGTLIALLAPGFPVLLIARIVQASGTAILMPMLMTTLMTVVPPQSRGRMMGRISVVMALAPAVGPTLSGIVLDTIGWRWIFGIVLPFALVVLAVGIRWIQNLDEPTRAPIDVLSVILSAFGFGGLVYGLSQIGGTIESEAAGTSSTAVASMVVALAVGSVALSRFIWRQVRLQRVDDALLDLRVFRTRNFTLAVIQFGLLFAGFFGTLTVLPLYLQQILGLSPSQTGLLLLPGSLAMGLLGPLVGRIYDKRGTRPLVVPGAIITTAMMWTATTFDQQTPFWFVAIVQTVMAIGLALSMTPLFTASLGSLPPQLYSYGSAVVGTVQQVAGAAGTALLIMLMGLGESTAAIAGAAELDAAAAGAQLAFCAAAMLLLPTILIAFLIHKPRADGPR